MCVCQFTAVVLTRKKPQGSSWVENESLKNIMEFRKVLIFQEYKDWGGVSLQDLNGSGNNCDGQITQSGSTRVCSAGLNSPLPWQRQHGLFPKILQHPQHSGGFQPTQPSTPSLGTAWEALRAVGLNYSDNLSHSSSWSRRGNPRWEAGSDPAFCRTISEPLSVPVYLSAL